MALQVAQKSRTLTTRTIRASQTSYQQETCLVSSSLFTHKMEVLRVPKLSDRDATLRLSGSASKTMGQKRMTMLLSSLKTKRQSRLRSQPTFLKRHPQTTLVLKVLPLLSFCLTKLVVSQQQVLTSASCHACQRPMVI